MTAFADKNLIEEYLANRRFKAGQTVQLGWFIFRIADDNLRPRIEFLDFQKDGL